MHRIYGEKNQTPLPNYEALSKGQCIKKMFNGLNDYQKSNLAILNKPQI